MLDWNNVFTEVAALVIGTLILSFCSGIAWWLHKVYNRIRSIDVAAQSLPILAKRLEEHDVRLSALEFWKEQQD